MRRINRYGPHGINSMSTVMVIERCMGPRRHFSGTLISEWMADARLNVRRCLGTTKPREGIENRMLKNYIAFPLRAEGAELSWLIVVRICIIGKGPG